MDASPADHAMITNVVKMQQLSHFQTGTCDQVHFSRSEFDPGTDHPDEILAKAMPYPHAGHRLMCRHPGMLDAGHGRLPRFDIPCIPQRVVQHGKNRLPCFLGNHDMRRYLSFLSDAVAATGSQLHAYVLMDNHVHLLVTPDGPGGVLMMMQRLGRRDVAEFNWRHGRTGTLWEGRFKSSLVESGSRVLACYRYIELNPMRARMVSQPEAFRWSCHAGNALGRVDPLLTPHPCYHALAATSEARAEAYRAIVRQQLSNEEVDSIRLHLQQQRPLGSDSFRSAIEAKTRRFAGVRLGCTGSGSLRVK